MITRAVRGAVEKLEPTFVFDPLAVEGKTSTDVEGLQDDGTYLLFHDEFHVGPNGYCMPIVEVKDKIERMHYHFDQCKLFGKFRFTVLPWLFSG